MDEVLLFAQAIGWLGLGYGAALGLMGLLYLNQPACHMLPIFAWGILPLTICTTTITWWGFGLVAYNLLVLLTLKRIRRNSAHPFMWGWRHGLQGAWWRRA